MKHTLSSSFQKMLRWSEKYTRTDMAYLASGGFWLLLGQAVNFLGTLVLVWFFANLLPKEAYGEYRFFIAAIAIFSLAALPGMNIALTRAVAQGHGKTVFPAIQRKMRWGLVGSALSFIAAAYYTIQGNSSFGLTFVFLGLIAPFVDTLALYPHYLRGMHDAKRETYYRNMQRLVVVVITVATLLYTKNILAILAAYLLSSLLLDAYFFRRSLKRHAPTGDADPGAMRYGMQLSFITALRLGTQYLDKIVLWYMAGPVQVATYVIAVAVPQEGSGALGRINYLALPKMATRNVLELHGALLRKIALFFVATVPVTIAYVIAVPFLFDVFFPQYSDAIFYSQLASIAFLLVPFGLLMQYFHATANTRALLILNVSEPIVLIALYAAFVPLFGILGVIVASLLKGVISTCLMLFLFFRDGGRVQQQTLHSLS